jgi:RimJ/RimL family protein N-acetyltransferase
VAVADLEPGGESRYIEAALEGLKNGSQLPWVVRELTGGQIVGSTRYHDIVTDIDRVEIGFTFYAARWQRTHVNTATKLLLLEHAFEPLGCAVVGFRVDNLNERSQRAVEALGAKRDGVIRHFQRRRDGSARDTFMYSILASEWPEVRQRLLSRLQRHAPAG